MEEKNFFDEKDLKFHKKLRAAYLEVARANPERIMVINASGTPEEVHARIVNVLKERGILE